MNFHCKSCGIAIEKNKWCQRCKEENIYHWSGKAVRKVMQRANYKCELCKTEIGSRGELHHIKPKSEGGNDYVENIQYLCRECHLEITNEWKYKKSRKYKLEMIHRKYKQLSLF